MSRTFKHIGQGLWNNGIEDISRPEIRIYLRYCDRHNRDHSYFSSKKIELREKILKKELSEQLNVFIMTKEDIQEHIKIRKEQLSNLIAYSESFEIWHKITPYSEKTYSEVKAKISSRMAFLERSIIDHERELCN